MALAGCQPAAAGLPSAIAVGPPAPFRTSSACPIVSSGEWAAHVDVMPGPGSRPTLIVTGTLGVKPAATTVLRLEPYVLESNPPQRVVTLVAAVPREPTIDLLTRREVRGQWPVTLPIGAVHIRCGGQTLDSLTNIVVAH